MVPFNNQNRIHFAVLVLRCRRYMKVIGCVAKFLSKQEMDLVRQWYRDIKTPKSYLLNVCPSKKCGKRDVMRKTSAESNVVFCDACGATWCEWCLGRIKSKSDIHDCDPLPVLRLCHQYTSCKSRRIQQLAQEKWPWLAYYAAARATDSVAMGWVQQNASICPRCSAAIERSEGCFHMKCRQCQCHFCYECETELFPPYYGTHHCWLEQDVLEDADEQDALADAEEVRDA